jgi:hypothetical protein
MSKVLYYREEKADPLSLDTWSGEEEILPFSDRHNLVQAIITEQDINCLIMQIKRINWDYQDFLSSLKKHFPLIRLGIICALDADVNTDRYAVIDSRKYDEDILEDIQQFIASSSSDNLRDHNRFSWILNGRLQDETGDWRDYQIYSISAGGAFLKCEQNAPVPNRVLPVEIRFRNFKMLTKGEILPRRASSSTLPEGFGIRFVNLDEESKDIIDEIVNDALYKVLIDPASQPNIPSLDPDQSLTPDFEII